MILIWESFLSSLRTLWSRPLLSALAVLTMGLGIGITTSQLISFQALLAPNLPFPNPQNLVTITMLGTNSNSRVHKDYFNKTLFYYWKEHQTSFKSLTSYLEGTINVYHKDRAIRYTGSWMNVEFTDTLEVQPFLGEGFRPGDEEIDSPSKAILAYDIWQQDFGGDPAIVGKEILVNSESTMVVGVMPENVVFPTNSHIWVQDTYYAGKMMPFDPKPIVMVSGRLKEGVSASEAIEELTRLQSDLATIIPEYAADIQPEGFHLDIVPFVVPLTDKNTIDTLVASTMVVVFILLIACANVTNLLLISYSTRLKEMAIRSALGATRTEIAFQLWLESFVIAAAGAGIGLIYCLWAVDWYNAGFTGFETPFWYHLSITNEAIQATFLVTMFCSILSALLPTLRVSRMTLNEILQDDSRTASSLTVGTINRSLVILQISVSCALLIVTGMILKQIHVVQSAEFGYDTKSVLGARFGLFDSKYKSASSKTEFTRKLLDELRSQDEIAEASITSRMQMLFSEEPVAYQVETDKAGVFEEKTNHGIFDFDSDGYFRSVGLEMLQGKDFDYDQPLVDGYKPVIVTQPFVDKHFPNQNVIGRRIRFPDDTSQDPDSDIYQIIGVAPHTFLHYANSDKEDEVGMHFFIENAPLRFHTVIVRPANGQNPYSLVPLLKRCVANIDKEIPLYFIETPADSFSSHMTGYQFGANVFILFAGVALFLCFVGIFGISSFSMLEKIQEIGIRKSLGATGEQIFMLIIRQGVLQLVIGVALGVGAGLTMGYTFRELFASLNLSFSEIEVYLIALAILAGSSMLATVYPARKAALILPAEATRMH